ncbi:hypothetical protein ND436_002805 [Neisseria gonorrhoeae]|nr:hypothetical protein [Neisseria gonorrhoeae]UYP52471.1 hypothetical protein ND436_002805 [Neisseria gonorrhoeae]
MKTAVTGLPMTHCGTDRTCRTRPGIQSGGNRQAQTKWSELGRGHERTQAKNEGKRENQRRKDAPNVMEMLQDGGRNVWQEAQQQMGQAFAPCWRGAELQAGDERLFKSMGKPLFRKWLRNL